VPFVLLHARLLPVIRQGVALLIVQCLGCLQGDAPTAGQQTGGRRRPRLASDVRRQGRQGRMSLIQIADFDVSDTSQVLRAV
jgi:hypothetical protein